MSDNLSPSEIYKQKKRERLAAKKVTQRKHLFRSAPKKMLTPLVIVVLFIFAGVIVWNIASIPKFPPTTMQGHVEQSPESHISTEPIPEVIQKHMLEHADGDGAPGIIIQYNCDDFECEPDLKKNLSLLVSEYPENVYLAPNDYAGKIILTKNGELKILDAFDDHAIRDFIEQSREVDDHEHVENS